MSKVISRTFLSPFFEDLSIWVHLQTALVKVSLTSNYLGTNTVIVKRVDCITYISYGH